MIRQRLGEDGRSDTPAVPVALRQPTGVERLEDRSLVGGWRTVLIDQRLARVDGRCMRLGQFAPPGAAERARLFDGGAFDVIGAAGRMEPPLVHVRGGDQDQRQIGAAKPSDPGAISVIQLWRTFEQRSNVGVIKPPMNSSLANNPQKEDGSRNSLTG